MNGRAWMMRLVRRNMMACLMRMYFTKKSMLLTHSASLNVYCDACVALKNIWMYKIHLEEVVLHVLLKVLHERHLFLQVFGERGHRVAVSIHHRLFRSARILQILKVATSMNPSIKQ